MNHENEIAKANADLDKELGAMQNRTVEIAPGGLGTETPSNGDQNNGSTAPTGGKSKKRLEQLKKAAEALQTPTTGAETSPPPADVPIEAIRESVHIIFEMISIWRKKAYWKAEDKEIAAFESPLKRYIDAHVPIWFKQNPDVALIVIGLGGMVGKRVFKDVREEIAKPKEEKK